MGDVYKRQVESTMAPASCPVCHHPQGYFVRMEMVPFH